jgi:ATP-dependent protease ClpP protease subunit
MAKIYLEGVIGEEITLKDTIRQVKSLGDVSEFTVFIKSIGGSVDEADKIYSYLDGLEAVVNTETSKAYSAAVKIFSVGVKREVEDKAKVLMVHLPWIEVKGTADKLEAVAEAMRGIEEDFAVFYSDLLGIDKDTVYSLLQSETYSSGKEAIGLGFATDIKETVNALAILDINNDNKDVQMKRTFREKGLAALKALKEVFEGEEPKAIVLQDSTGVDIEFPDVEEGANPAKGDKGLIDGEAITDGTYIMPSLDNASVVFVGGVIDEIIPEEEEGEEGTEGEGAEGANAAVVKQVCLWEMEVENESFAVGDKVTYTSWDDEVYNVGSGEYELDDGRRIVTDASGVIVKIKEGMTLTEEQAEASAQALILRTEIEAKVTVKAEAEISAKYEDEITQLKADKVALNAKIKSMGSKELDLGGVVPKGQKVSTNKDGEQNSTTQAMLGK